MRRAATRICERREVERVSEDRAIELGLFERELDMLIASFDTARIQDALVCVLAIAEHQTVTFAKIRSLFTGTSEFHSVHVYWQIAAAQMCRGLNS
jgi:hypothetical protein